MWRPAAAQLVSINGNVVKTLSLASWRAAIRSDPCGVSLAVLAGVAVPLAAFGKAVMAVPLVPAALAALILTLDPAFRARVYAIITRPEGVAVTVFFLLALLSALFSDHMAKSVFTVARSVLFVGFAAVLATVLADNTARAKLAHKALLVGSAISLAYVCWTVYVDNSLHIWLNGGGNARQSASAELKAFGSSAACLLPVLLWAAGQVWPRAAISVPAIVLAVFLVVWLGGDDLSRAGVLGIIVGLGLTGLVFLVRRMNRQFRIAAVASVVLIVLALSSVIAAKLPTSADIQQGRLALPWQLIDLHRQVIWRFTLDAAERRPLLGYGPNTINLIEGAKDIARFPSWTRVSADAEFLPSHPHNWVLEIASETGLLCLTALLLALLLVLRRVANLALAGAQAGWAAVFVFGAFWGSSLANFSIWAAWWQLTFLVLLAIAVAGARQSLELTRSDC